jgi:hypothetical protein
VEDLIDKANSPPITKIKQRLDHYPYYGLYFKAVKKPYPVVQLGTLLKRRCCMKQNEQAYVKLQKHLDNQAIGFPATRSGVELKILKHIFTPQEAEIRG